jgi:hypothetical protein
VNGFPQLFQLCSHIAQGYIWRQIAHDLVTLHLLAMTKLSGGVCPIVVGEMLYQFTSCTLCIQFCETFTTNFSLHQFRVATKSGCATIIHSIGCTLDLHLDWVVFQPDMVNAFNLMLIGVVFQKLRVTNGDII